MAAAPREIYKERLVGDAGKALERVPAGGRIFLATGAAEPTYLTGHLAEKMRLVVDTELIHVWTLGPAPYLKEGLGDRFRLNTFYPIHQTVQAVRQGHVDYTPAFLSQIPEMFRSELIHLDVALIQVTPPDAHGYVSLGVSVDITKAAALSADLVVAQVNPRMPRTHGDSFIHVSKIDVFVRHADPLPETPLEQGTEVHQEIGRHVAALIPDGATVHVGLGQVPKAATSLLEDRRDLGVHTEFFSDWLLDLMEAGIINNAKKTLHPHKVVAAFCMGTKRLYDFIHDNPAVELYPSDYVNDPTVIARNHLMVSINNAYQVDLTGQVCTDWPVSRFYVGPEGQADFIRGTARARGGRPIVAISSMTEDGSESRIVPRLTDASAVTITRADVHFVVTEYGIATLKGKSIRERALALIDTAHPSVRAELLAEAKARRYVFLDQLPPTEGTTDLDAMTARMTLSSGESATLRPVRATDERMVQELFHGLSTLDRYFRFFSSIQSLPHKMAQKLCHSNYRDEMAVVVTMPRGEEGEMVVGSGQFILNRKHNLAEIAIMVRQDQQHKGLGTALLKHLIRLARSQGIRGIRAEILPDNRPMLRLLKTRGFPVRTQLKDQSMELTMMFEDLPDQTTGTEEDDPSNRRGT